MNASSMFELLFSFQEYADKNVFSIIFKDESSCILNYSKFCSLDKNIMKFIEVLNEDETKLFYNHWDNIIFSDDLVNNIRKNRYIEDEKIDMEEQRKRVEKNRQSLN